MVQDEEKTFLKSKSLDNPWKENSHSILKWEWYETKTLLSLKLYTCNNPPSIKMGGVPPFWPIYIGERKTTFAKTYGIKNRCLYYEDGAEKNGNLMGTLWKHIGNDGIFLKTPPQP